MRRPLSVSALCLATLGTAPAPATPADCSEDAMLVFDGSGSMSEIGFDATAATRIEEARIAVARAIPDVAPFRRMGLVVYGAGAEACAIDLRFGPRAAAGAAIVSAVDALEPGGLTPLAGAVQLAAEALSYRDRPGVIVVVTDGNETCGGRPCALGSALAAEAGALTIHVIGFRVEVDFWTWDNPEQESYSNDRSVARCLAERTGGLFVTTETVDELVEALQATLGCPVIGQTPARRKTPPA
ncbi:vWA domain-containing protein [Pseudooceanicola sp.]|uniref:vWA domain-containing protein n=1 Tax=Pseudooceanicola sp. TaxID=1914328 RepID=UPI004059C1EA